MKGRTASVPCFLGPEDLRFMWWLLTEKGLLAVSTWELFVLTGDIVKCGGLRSRLLQQVRSIAGAIKQNDADN